MILTIFEFPLAILAVFSAFFLFYLVFHLKTLQIYCRIYLYLLSFATFLLSSYILSIIEYLLAGKSFALVEDEATTRSKTWEFLHEIGLCLQSVSILCFAFVGDMILATFVVSCFDIFGLSVLIAAWRQSIRDYSRTQGKISLNRRYQISVVYTTTSALLPAAFGASISRSSAMVPIWFWLLLDMTGAEYGIANFLFNNIINAYIVILPWIIAMRNAQLRHKLLSIYSKCYDSPRVHAERVGPIKTLQGTEIKPCANQSDHFNELRTIWN
ncbi:unnamed protein product [Caenorhabditis bovis]|uniref:Uncharacterized protein n=1 Tax=Caenorhabditis bovis TaxID=2654633 RepID=A0A8S1EER3_9PELO|nr:unnamed protein product [Caenorhabditis bovis]